MKSALFALLLLLLLLLLLTSVDKKSHEVCPLRIATAAAAVAVDLC